ncbi:MAG: hypothetical protein WBA74_06195, partial [Cyclobacteriaceae bacterium]
NTPGSTTVKIAELSYDQFKQRIRASSDPIEELGKVAGEIYFEFGTGVLVDKGVDKGFRLLKGVGKLDDVVSIGKKVDSPKTSKSKLDDYENFGSDTLDDFSPNQKTFKEETTTSNTIGLTDDAAELATSNIGRVDHSARHLIDEGIIIGNPGSKGAREVFQDLANDILTNPLKSFDHKMSRGGQRVKGFLGEKSGKSVIIFVAKEANGKIASGDIVTTIVPTAQQLINFGL